MIKLIKATDDWFDNHPVITGIVEFICLATFFGAGYFALIIWG